MAGDRALVLGGGGLAGIAWETGIVHGLAEAGCDVTDADLIVGTSAGATVAAYVASGRPLEHWYRRQVDPEQQNHELLPAGMSMEELLETFVRLLVEFPDAAERRRQVGSLALAADTADEPTRRAIIAGRFPGVSWPGKRLAITAVEAGSGDRVVFDSAGDVDLIDAVAASSAVPGVWPPVTIGPQRYIDGGMYSITNADLAAGHARVLILSLRVGTELDEEVAGLQASGQVEVIFPDAASTAAFGANPLDPAIRAPSAQAGYAQGKALGPALAPFWAG